MYDDQQQLGDGQDNYLRGAQKIAEAAKQAGTASAAGVKRPPMQPPRQ